MKNLKRILSILTVFVLSLGVLCFAGCKTEEDVKTPTAGTIDITNISSNGIRLFSQEVITVDDHLEQTITATVTGGDSNTKLVWSIAWDNPGMGDINNFLTLSPSVDGKSCVVKCYGDFGNFGDINAIITVAVEGQPNINAVCVVTYLGYPTELYIERYFNELQEGSAKTVSVRCLRDMFEMNSSFDDATINVKIKMSGSVTVLCTYYDEEGNPVESKEVIRNLTDPKKFDLTIGSNTCNVDFSKYYNDRNFLTYDSAFKTSSPFFEIGTHKVINKFRVINQDVTTNDINGVLVDFDLTFTVTFTESTSGVTNSFDFKLKPMPSASVVTGIVLDQNRIYF